MTPDEPGQSPDQGSQSPDGAARRVKGAERSLRRADLLDERAVERTSRSRHFRMTAKWLVPGALLSALGVSLGAWEVALSLLTLLLLALAAWVFIGANAREDMIADELRELDAEHDASRGDVP